jgi:uncharacterized membrane protein (DUF106 family)
MSGIAGQEFSVNLQGTIATANGYYEILVDATVVANGTTTGNSVNTDFSMPAVFPGTYNVTLRDAATQTSAIESIKVSAEGLASIPTATVLIMLVAISISFMNMGLNRLLITKMIGWHAYRTMQKELQEYNSQRMAALRSKDTKTLERLKKKDSQMQAMQSKMFKPQLVLIPITFIYLIIWPVLTGVFPFWVAYVPGLGPQPFFVWYLISSFFFGTIASRIIGVTPIQ